MGLLLGVDLKSGLQWVRFGVALGSGVELGTVRG